MAPASKRPFHTASDAEIKSGEVSDVYFVRTSEILRHRNDRRRVKAEVYLKSLPDDWQWGILAGIFNSVPYLGPIIVTGGLGLVAFLQFDSIPRTLMVCGAAFVITSLEGFLLTPALMGRQLELNPFAVFLAIAFCTWLWGPIGAFVSVPLLMALTVALGHALAEDKPELPE